jgi:TonB family protein
VASSEKLPVRFGPYLLTAALGADGLGSVYRARKTLGKSFHRLRVFGADGLAEDPILTAIENNGEVHEFLKNPAIVRSVEMDAVEGLPYIAWEEPTGRTLDVLLDKVARIRQAVPVEHALLIAEKVATALDHAYNTTVDGERTLHGLVWPGFVTISDDGEVRLAGFGLAEGILASRGAPGVSAALFPFLPPSVRASGKPLRNGDVYSVGALLYRMLTGQPPPLTEAQAAIRNARLAQNGNVIPSDIAGVLQTALAPAEDQRYETDGDLRREIGKLLFSGRYQPSTFNLAFFMNKTFRAEIEQETRARQREEALDAAQYPRELGTTPLPPPPPPPPRETPAASAALAAPRKAQAPGRRSPLLAVSGLLVLLAVGGGILLLARRPETLRRPAPSPPAPAPKTAASAPTVSTPPVSETVSPPTQGMTEDQYKAEIARRVAAEMKKLSPRLLASKTSPPASAGTRAAPAAPISTETAAPKAAAEAPTEAESPPATTAAAKSASSASKVEPARQDANQGSRESPRPAPPSASAAAPLPTPAAPKPPAVHEGDLVGISDVDVAPTAFRIVKPVYPPIALQMRISGTVVLDVLISEKGDVLQVRVIRGARAGLTEAALSAVRQWKFTPAKKEGKAVRTWMVLPVPFVR